MKYGPVIKFAKRNKTTSKIFDDNVISAYCDVIVIFPICGWSGAIQKPNSGRIVCKTYIFINSNFLSYKNWKQNYKISNVALTLLFWVKVQFFKKLLTSAKLRRPWYWKVYFLKLHVCVLTCQIWSFYHNSNVF